ncbi:MAG: putative histidine kinase [Clostridia bacterium]|nr:putative histidine kinase [Clostridia bacterium]
MKRMIINKEYVKASALLIIASIIFIMTLSGFSGRFSEYPIEKGQIDLTKWDQTTTVMLNGHWEFYWKELLEYEQLTSRKPEAYVRVPGTWNGYNISENQIKTGIGYATFKLHLKLPPDMDVMAVKLPTMASAYKVYINQNEVCEVGKVAVDKLAYRPVLKGETVIFEVPETHQADIIIQVANYDYARGGIWYPIRLGTEEGISSYKFRVHFQHAFLFGAVCIMGIFFFIMFCFKPHTKVTLYFSALCVLLVLYYLFNGETYITQFYPEFHFKGMVLIFYICIYTSLGLLMLIIKEILDSEISSTITRWVIYQGLFFSVLASILPVKIFTAYVVISDVMLIIGTLYILFCTARAVVKKQTQAIIVFCSLFILFFTLLHDVLYTMNIIATPFNELAAWGLILLMISFSSILSYKFSVNYQNEKLLNEKLSGYDKIRDEFLINTAHELLTPLGHITGTTELLMREIKDKLNKNQLEQFVMNIQVGKRLANIVRSIADISRIKSGDIQLEISDFEITTLLNSIINNFQYIVRGQEVEIMAEFGALSFVRADKDKVIQSFYNVIGNAVKFTSKGQIQVAVVQEEDTVKICVQDTGCGIAPENIDKIFIPFERLNQDEYEGMGIGLAVTKQLIEKMGGSIQVYSEVGTGSQFEIVLVRGERKDEVDAPYLEEVSAVHQEDTEDIEGQSEGDNKGTIVIVDDTVHNIRIIKEAVKQLGYRIISFTNPLEALEAYEKQKEVLLIIVDVMMPQMSGYELVEEIRKKYDFIQLPILLLTVKDRTSEMVKGFSVGANDYVTKPFNSLELSSRAKNLIELKLSTAIAKQNEVAFLRSQIKPHFLFNALSVISSFCSTDSKTAQKLIIELSKFLRGSFLLDDLLIQIPFEEELSLIKSYVEIEKARFGEQLRVVYVLKDTGYLQVPPLILQPIVENAIRHGIRKKKNGGTVTITAALLQNEYSIEVCDDGVGMDERTIENIKHHIRQSDSGVGLINIDKRLMEIYHTRLQIESSKGRGTKIGFKIPVEGGGNFESNDYR